MQSFAPSVCFEIHYYYLWVLVWKQESVSPFNFVFVDKKRRISPAVMCLLGNRLNPCIFDGKIRNSFFVVVFLTVNAIRFYIDDDVIRPMLLMSVLTIWRRLLLVTQVNYTMNYVFCHAELEPDRRPLYVFMSLRIYFWSLHVFSHLWRTAVDCFLTYLVRCSILTGFIKSPVHAKCFCFPFCALLLFIVVNTEIFPRAGFQQRICFGRPYGSAHRPVESLLPRRNQTFCRPFLRPGRWEFTADTPLSLRYCLLKTYIYVSGPFWKQCILYYWKCHPV